MEGWVSRVGQGKTWGKAMHLWGVTLGKTSGTSR